MNQKERHRSNINSEIKSNEEDWDLTKINNLDQDQWQEILNWD